MNGSEIDPKFRRRIPVTCQEPGCENKVWHISMGTCDECWNRIWRENAPILGIEVNGNGKPDPGTGN